MKKILFGIFVVLAGHVGVVHAASNCYCQIDSSSWVSCNQVYSLTQGNDKCGGNINTCNVWCVYDSSKGEYVLRPYKVLSCLDGYELKDNNCVKKEEGKVKEAPKHSAGDDCTPADLASVNFATAGVYVKSGDGLKCSATACKSGTYLVVSARGQSQGWCVAASYCKSTKKLDNHTLNVIDGTKTDLKCIAPESDDKKSKRQEDKIAAVENKMVGRATQMNETGGIIKKDAPRADASKDDSSADDESKEEVDATDDNTEEVVEDAEKVVEEVNPIVEGKNDKDLVTTGTTTAKERMTRLWGSVVDENNEPLIGVTVVVPGTTKGMATDIDGKFDDRLMVADDTVIEVSYVGCETKKFKAAELQNKNIVLNCNETIDEVIVTDSFKSRDCNAEELKEANATVGTTAFIDGKMRCVPSACLCGYVLEKESCRAKTKAEKVCTKKTNPQLPDGAKTAEMVCDANGQEYCKISQDGCLEFHKLDVAANKCNSLEGTKCVNDQVDSSGEPQLEYKVVDGALKCVVVKCGNKDFKPNSDKTACEQVSGNCTPDDANAVAGAIRNGQCVATKCKTDFKPNKQGVCEHGKCSCGQKLDGNNCVDKTDDEKVCSIKNATKALLTCEKGKEVCRVVECAKDYKENNKKTKCESVKNDKCEFDGETKEFVKTARWREQNNKVVCVITDCIDGYMVDKQSNTCVVSEGPCTEEQLKEIKNATKGELRKGKCQVTECVPGMEPVNNKCVEISGSCSPTDGNATMGTRKFDTNSQSEICVVTGCVGGYKPSDDQMSCVPDAVEQAKIDELRENYEEVKANEQSLANRMLGGASMGAMGIGGMMVASSLSEQKSDADAERDMAAYLATFKCDYGAGRNFKGGETNIELPGASELIPLYSEYVSLANDLKLRKEQLGLKAGIEAEKILDSATTGLYDDVGVGITSGAYASLARALQNPDGADAKMWAEQKEKTAKNLKTGAITAGVGAVVGIAGNAIVNHKAKNKANEIVTRYESMKQLKRDVDAISPAKTQCPNGASGTYPDCVCDDAEYNVNSNACEKCAGGQTIKKIGGEQKCVCPDDKPMWTNGKCEAMPAGCEPQCDVTQGGNLIVNDDCSCACSNHFTLVNGVCVCDGKVEDGKCVIIKTETKIEQVTKTLFTSTETSSVSLDAGHLFKIGSAELQPAAKTALKDFAINLKKEGVSDCKLTITGYTDPVGGETKNQTLSENRANAVKSYLMNLRDFVSVMGEEPDAHGMGENSCFCGVGTIPAGQEKNADYVFCNGKAPETPVVGNTRFAPCRRVVIEAKCKKTTSSSALLDGIQDGGAGK